MAVVMHMGDVTRDVNAVTLRSIRLRQNFGGCVITNQHIELFFLNAHH